MLGKSFTGAQKTDSITKKSMIINASTTQASEDLDLPSQPPRSCSAEKKLSWLRSEIIGGGNAEFGSPFGKRRLTYADHTASGRCLHYIENYIINHVLPNYGNTHTSDNYMGRRTTKMGHEVNEYITRQLGGNGQDHALLFCGSGTTGAIKRLQEVMGIAVPSTLRDRMLRTLRSEERWVVFVGPQEHHSNFLSWWESLADVVQIGLDDNGLLDMEALRMKLESYRYANRPLLGSFSACSNVTGIYSDTRALATLLHQYGGFACFDFAASAPYVEIDMRSGKIDGYDAIFLSPHKFLGGPGSPGVLLMSKTLYLLPTSPPSTCDYVNGFNDKDTLYSEDIEERENAGTPPIIQKTRAALAFWVKEYIGYQVIEKQEHTYITKALERLLPNENIWVLGNTNGLEQLHMWRETGNKRDKPLHGPFVAKLLNDLFGIQARGGCACAGPYGHKLLGIDETCSLGIRSAIQKGYTGVKTGWTRISFPYYMSNEEFEFIIAAVEFISIYGMRFLPLYRFNWKTGNWTFKKAAFQETLVGKEKNYNFIQALNLDSPVPEEHNMGEAMNVGMINKYASYLETAKSIASRLPRFPAQREIPEDIDHNILHFRV